MQRKSVYTIILSEEEFNNTWETLKGMVGLMKTDYELEDLSYEECYSHPWI